MNSIFTNKILRYLPLLWLLFLGFLLMSRILLTQDKTTLAGFDNSVQFYSWFTYVKNSLAQGSLPLWDPHQFSGHSFIGEMQTGLFYPLNLIMFFALASIREDTYNTYAPTIIETFSLIHLIIGSFSAYWMLRELDLNKHGSLVGATAFSYSGFIFNRQFGQLCVFYSVIWIPFIFAAYLRHYKVRHFLKKIFWLNTSGVGLGMSILSGHYLGFIYSGFILLAYSLFYLIKQYIQNHHLFKYFIKIVLVSSLSLTIVFLSGLAFSSIQLFPTIEYSELSLRWVNAPKPIASGDSIPYEVIAGQFRYSIGGLFSLLNPIFKNLNTTTIDGYLYSGIVPLFFSIIGIYKFAKKEIEVIFFVLVLFVSLFYSLGGDSILHVIYNSLPFSDPSRSASRISCLVHFSIICLTAFFIDKLTNNLNSKIQKQLLSICFLTIKFSTIVSLVLAIVSLLFRSINISLITSLITTNVLLMITSSFIIVYLPNKKIKLASWILTLSLTILIIQDTYYFQVSQLPSRSDSAYPPTILEKNKPIFKHFDVVNKNYRIANLIGSEIKNFGNILGINMTMGHGASMPKNYYNFLVDLGWDNQKINDLLSARYILNLDKNGTIKLEENPSALPIFRLVQNFEVIDNLSLGRDILKQENFDYRANVILDRKPNFPESEQKISTTDDLVQIDKYQANQVTLSVTSQNPKILVFGDQYYPGWVAYVNGSKSDILLANTLFKAVSIPSGKSKVEFKYSPTSLYLGAILTLIATLVYACTAVLSQFYFFDR